jgi:hypothetical protein
MPKKLLPVIATLTALSACVNAPRNDHGTASTPPGSVVTETRALTTDDPRPVVAAAVEILRNLGYEIDPSGGDGRSVVAWKTEDITLKGRGNPALVLAFLGHGPIAIPRERKIRASFTLTKQTLPQRGVLADIAFQRITWDTAGDIMRVESIDDPKLYDGFFARLSQRGALAVLER